jgi:aminopeptidase C
MKEYNDAHTKDAVFHTDAETRKICNDKNNARNRCWYTEEAAANRLNLVESEWEMERLLYNSGELEEDDTSDIELE